MAGDGLKLKECHILCDISTVDDLCEQSGSCTARPVAFPRGSEEEDS